ncbi:hypothetical protein ACJX0J_035867, partial [Zea mays]
YHLLPYLIFLSVADKVLEDWRLSDFTPAFFSFSLDHTYFGPALLKTTICYAGTRTRMPAVLQILSNPIKIFIFLFSENPSVWIDLVYLVKKNGQADTSCRFHPQMAAVTFIETQGRYFVNLPYKKFLLICMEGEKQHMIHIKIEIWCLMCSFFFLSFSFTCQYQEVRQSILLKERGNGRVRTTVDINTVFLGNILVYKNTVQTPEKLGVLYDHHTETVRKTLWEIDVNHFSILILIHNYTKHYCN